jgi:hypothetical protein
LLLLFLGQRQDWKEHKPLCSELKRKTATASQPSTNATVGMIQSINSNSNFNHMNDNLQVVDVPVASLPPEISYTSFTPAEIENMSEVSNFKLY